MDQQEEGYTKYNPDREMGMAMDDAEGYHPQHQPQLEDEHGYSGSHQHMHMHGQQQEDGHDDPEQLHSRSNYHVTDHPISPYPLPSPPHPHSHSHSHPSHSHAHPSHIQTHTQEQSHGQGETEQQGQETLGSASLIPLPLALPLTIPSLPLGGSSSGSLLDQIPSGSTSNLSIPQSPSQSLQQQPQHLPVHAQQQNLQTLGHFEPREYPTFDDLYESVVLIARESGFGISIYNPTRSKKGILRASNLRCSKSGLHRETRTPQERLRKVHSTKTNCPFYLYAHRVDPETNRWTFGVKSEEHNHEPDFERFGGRPVRRRVRAGGAGASAAAAAGAGGAGGRGRRKKVQGQDLNTFDPGLPLGSGSGLDNEHGQGQGQVGQDPLDPSTFHHIRTPGASSLLSLGPASPSPFDPMLPPLGGPLAHGHAHAHTHPHAHAHGHGHAQQAASNISDIRTRENLHHEMSLNGAMDVVGSSVNGMGLGIGVGVGLAGGDAGQGDGHEDGAGIGAGMGNGEGEGDDFVSRYEALGHGLEQERGIQDETYLDGYREDEGLLSRGVMGGHHGHDHEHEHDEHEQPHDPHPHPHPEDLDPSLAPLSRTTTPTSSAHETLVKEHSVLLRLQFLESEVERLKRVEREHDSLRTRMALDRVVMGQSEEGGIEGDAAGTPDGPDAAEGLGFDRE